MVHETVYMDICQFDVLVNPMRQLVSRQSFICQLAYATALKNLLLPPVTTYRNAIFV